MNKKSVHGFALVDKEKGVSSFFVLKQLKARLAREGSLVRKVTDGRDRIDLKHLKIGHAGTLDPIATGLLVVAVGEATKLLEYVVGADKVYAATAFLGAVTETYDAEGEVNSTDFSNDANEGGITLKLIKKVVQKFTGEIKQIPPKFSAKKIGGVSAYKLAREGQEVSMKECAVRVDAIDVISFKWPELKMRVKCSSGTYIRSLIHDIGQALKCGAYMLELRRFSVGGFDVRDAVKVDDFSFCDVREIEKFTDLKVIDFGDDVDSFNRLNRGMFVKASAPKDSVFLGKFNGKIFAILEKCKDGVGLVKVKKKLNVFV